MKSRTFSSTVISFPLNAGEYRDAVEKFAVEKAKQKQRAMSALISPKLDAQSRIRIWEWFHGLNLPKASDHRLLDEIATKTALTVDQVRQEQVRRLTPAASDTV